MITGLRLKAPEATLLASIRARAAADGGVAAHPGLPADTESTAWVALAMRVRPEPELRALATGAADWLARVQAEDGSWPFAEGLPAGSWATSPALLALADEPGREEAVERGADWLLGNRGRSFVLADRIRYWLFPDRQAIRLDPELQGWAWAPGTFSWVEPTSLALMALAAAAPGRGHGRLDEARRMLRDRVCPDGGWNYGNSVVLGEELTGYPDTTALALLGLRGEPPDELIRRGLDALVRMLDGPASLLSLALASLCLRAYGREPRAVDERIRAAAGSLEYDDARAIALALIALGPDPRIVRRADA